MAPPSQISFLCRNLTCFNEDLNHGLNLLHEFHMRIFLYIPFLLWFMKTIQTPDYICEGFTFPLFDLQSIPVHTFHMKKLYLFQICGKYHKITPIHECSHFTYGNFLIKPMVETITKFISSYLTFDPHFMGFKSLLNFMSKPII